MRYFALVTALFLTLPGCGRRAPTPEDTFRSFHQSLVRYARSGHPAYQAQAYALLTQDSQDALSARAEAVNRSLPEGVEPLEPNEMLQVLSLTVDKGIDDISVEELGEGRVKVVARLDDCREEGDKIRCTKISLPLAREKDGWRVELLSGDG